MKKHRVLIVEDDSEMAEMLEATLSTAFDVHVCTEKAHAVVRAKEYLEEHGAPDAVVIDLIINGEGGMDLYQWMLEHGYQPPLIFLTGCHQYSPEYQAATASGEIVYEKDHFSSKQLVGLINDMVENAEVAEADFPPGVHRQCERGHMY